MDLQRVDGDIGGIGRGEGKGRKGKEREGKGREGKGREGREGKGQLSEKGRKGKSVYRIEQSIPYLHLGVRGKSRSQQG